MHQKVLNGILIKLLIKSEGTDVWILAIFQILSGLPKIIAQLKGQRDFIILLYFVTLRYYCLYCNTTGASHIIVTRY